MRRLLPFLVVAIMASVTGPAAAGTGGAEPHCEARRTMLSFLATRYDEQPVAMGVAEDGDLIEVLTSKSGTTFTIIVTSPEGRTCLVAAGEGWEMLSRRPVRLPI